MPVYQAWHKKNETSFAQGMEWIVQTLAELKSAY